MRVYLPLATQLSHIDPNVRLSVHVTVCWNSSGSLGFVLVVAFVPQFYNVLG